MKSTLVLALAALLIGCGGSDEPENTGPPPPRKTKKKEEEKVGDGKVREVASWNAIRPFFLGEEGGRSGAVNGPVQTLRDPFEPLLVKWVPRVEVEEDEPVVDPAAGTEEPVEPIGETVDPVDVSETQRFKVQDYRVLMIRWGTSVNKAVVVDPEGLEFVVVRDMKLGNNNGRVVDITQFEVVVKEDSRDEPIVLSIQPELRPLGEDQEQITERLFKNQTSE